MVGHGCNPLPHVGTAHLGHMKAPDIVPLAAWFMWQMLFDEPKPTDAHPKAPPEQEPSDVKTAPGSK